MRPPWSSLPERVRAAVEDLLGFAVVETHSQAGGFSPGVAARVVGPAGERAFVKVASGEVNPVTPGMHRDEAVFTALLPPDHPSPRLLGSWDDGTWVALALEDVDGRPPASPWTSADLAAAVAALDLQATVAAAPSLPSVSETHGPELVGWRELLAGDASLTPWEARHLPALAALEATWEAAAAGDRWLHLDTRGDNMLVRRDGTAVLVDWPGSCAGNPLFDAVAFVPAAVRDGALGVVPGGAAAMAVADVPPERLAAACEELLSRFAAARTASSSDVTALVCAFAGLMQYRMRRPPPPAMPTVRAFQASQGAVALTWLQHRTGWA
jgi:aminoglycoside phosphotransferase (APT) family kinase protein